jgi:hypothetical protein
MDKAQDLSSTVLERAQAPEGRKKLTCAEAFELAREFETEVIEVGRICNQHKNLSMSARLL